MRRAAAIAAAGLALAAGCQREEGAADAPVDSPRLEAWPLPLTSRPELPSARIGALHRDRDGVLWLATPRGASAFDPRARTWAYFPRADRSSTPLGALARDRDGVLWLGGTAGVRRVDPTTGAWAAYTSKDGVAEGAVQVIAEGAEGTLWFGTTRGVSRLDPRTRAWTTYTSGDGFARGEVRAIAHDRLGGVWIGTLGGGLSHLQPETRALQTYTERDGLPSDVVRAIVDAGGADGALWLGTSGGVTRLDPAARAFTTPLPRDALGGAEVVALAPADGGALWVGTPDGVTHFDPATRAAQAYPREDLAPDGTLALAPGEDGALWAGTSAGLLRLDPGTGAWVHHAPHNELHHAEILAITRDRAGAVWFGTDQRGAVRLDPATRAWEHYPLSGGGVSAIAASAEGPVWFGTRGDGVARFDAAAVTWSWLADPPAGGGDDVRGLAVADGGALWVVGPGGVTRVDPRAGSRATRASPAPVHAFTPAADGSLWFGHEGAVSHLDPKRGAWTRVPLHDDSRVQPPVPVSSAVLAAVQAADGALWFGTSDAGLARLDPETGAWTRHTTQNGLPENSVRKLAVTADGALWAGLFDGGVARLDPSSRSWTTYAAKDGLAAGGVHAIAEDEDGALWIAAGSGLSRLVLGGARGASPEAGTLLSVGQSASRLAVTSRTVAVTRPSGVSLVTFTRDERAGVERALLDALPAFPAGADTTAVAPGPPGAVWVGTAFSGLAVRRSGAHLPLTRKRGLPSDSVTALAVLPGSGHTRVWVGTTAGAALAALEPGEAGEAGELRVERVLAWDGMPTGPVDALAAAADGSVFLAYNALPAKRFLDPDLAARRAQTRVFRAAPGAPVREIPAGERLAAATVRSLAFSEKHGLWAGSSAGLFVAPGEAAPAGSGARVALRPGFEAVTGQGRLPPMPVRHLAVAPDAARTLWMAVDRQGDTPALVVGYRPGTEWVSILTPDLGLPLGNAVDDMAFTDDGHLVVLMGARLARGQVFVPPVSSPRSPLFWLGLAAASLLVVAALGAAVVVQRRSAYHRLPLRDLPLPAIATAIAAMRRLRVLDEAWSRLGLPPTRIPLFEALAPSEPPGPAQLRALAELLGMEDAAAAPVDVLPHGLSLLTARLPYPAPLRGHPIALVAMDGAEARRAEPARVRAALEKALRRAGQRFELPFVLLAGGEVTGDWLPTDLGSLRLGDRELRALLFAPDPEHAFAGLLHARRLLALSPYSTAGEVKDDQMFFGRTALLKEMLLASSIQQLVVGPRRVGKTSLLKRLLRELPARRPDLDPVYVDLLGVTDHARAARVLARALRAPAPAAADPEAAFADLLRARFEAPSSTPRRRGVVLLDEADGLVEADAARGFPLLSALRALQAEEVCSFVLAGYLYLYREALNQRSPLYNFATARVLGPLEPEAARELALVPMQRLGVTYADPALPEQIARRTGGYPSFIQMLCDAALAVLREDDRGDLTLSAAHLARAGERAEAELREIFRMNTGPEAQRMASHLAALGRESFSVADAQRALEGAPGRAAPPEAAEAALLELRLLGLVVEQRGRFSWAIPLLCDALRAESARLPGTAYPGSGAFGPYAPDGRYP